MLLYHPISMELFFANGFIYHGTDQNTEQFRNNTKRCCSVARTTRSEIVAALQAARAAQLKY